MTDLTPKNITDANRMANAWAKASRLTADGYRFITCTEANSPVLLVAVYKPEDAPSAPSYWLRKGFTAPEIQNGCSCPAYAQTGIYCKHIFAYEDMQNTEAALNAYFAEEENAECANGVDSLL